MSALERDFLKAKLARLPLTLPDEAAAQHDDENDDQEEELQDGLGALPPMYVLSFAYCCLIGSAELSKEVLASESDARQSINQYQALSSLPKRFLFDRQTGTPIFAFITPHQR